MLLTAKPYIAVIQGAEILAKTEILLSCMFLSDSKEMIKRSHITSDTVIINQCDEENYKEENICNALLRTFSVTDRGLTKSRNLAISKSQADICIICDDDEIFNDGYEKAVSSAYDALPDADIIIFDMVDRPLKWGNSIKRLGYIDLMNVICHELTLMTQMDHAIVMLPQPFVTVAQGQVEGLRMALDLTAEWEKLDNGSQFITAGLVVRKAFAEENPQALATFLEEYQASTEYVNNNIPEAAQLVEQYDIVKAAVAEQAIPYCNIVYIDKEEMQTAVSGYLQTLYDLKPDSVGGAMPGDDFYYYGE